VRNGAERLALANKGAAMDRAGELRPVLTEPAAAGMSARQIAAAKNQYTVIGRFSLTETSGQAISSVAMRGTGSDCAALHI
jgi:hypothetical protein